MLTREQILKEISGCCISDKSAEAAVESILKLLSEIDFWEIIKNDFKNDFCFQNNIQKAECEKIIEWFKQRLG